MIAIGDDALPEFLAGRTVGELADLVRALADELSWRAAERTQPQLEWIARDVRRADEQLRGLVRAERQERIAHATS